MTNFATELAARRVNAVTFNFLYTDAAATAFVLCRLAKSC
jgi:hypothetical protein